MVNIAVDVQKHKMLFFGAAIFSTALTIVSSYIDVFIGTEMGLIIFSSSLASAIAALLLWVMIMDWFLTPFCPRCGTEMRGIKTVMIKKRTAGGHWLKAQVHHKCPKCGYKLIKYHHVTKPVYDLHKRQGISKYWRF